MNSLVNSALASQTTDDDLKIGTANIKVVGCGGAGSNMVGWLHRKGIQGAEILAMNTDKQHLDITSADHKLLIGRELTRGLGAGGFPDKGMQAAKENLHDLKSLLKDS
ncbi:MAG: cell division protein FtsZ, partial [Nanoarchaeota archaeon]